MAPQTRQAAKKDKNSNDSPRKTNKNTNFTKENIVEARPIPCESHIEGIDVFEEEGIPRTPKKSSDKKPSRKLRDVARAIQHRGSTAMSVSPSGDDSDEVKSSSGQDGSSTQTGKETGVSPSTSSISMAKLSEVATQVMNTQRAAQGFKEMWVKEGTWNRQEAIVGGIHLEKKKLDLNRVASEYKEEKRSQFYQELLLYIIFLTVYFLLLGWLPVHDSFEQSSVVNDLICKNAKAPCHLDNIADIYNFVEHLQHRVCHATDEEWYANRFVRLGGVRVRQVRVRPMRCEVVEGSAQAAAAVETETGTGAGRVVSWGTSCYPVYSAEWEEKDPIIRYSPSSTGASTGSNTGNTDSTTTGSSTGGNTGSTTGNSTGSSSSSSSSSKATTYVWQDGLRDLQPWLHWLFYDLFYLPRGVGGFGFTDSYGRGGYVVDVCRLSDGVNALKQDTWIDLSTRAISIEFTIVNPATKIFTVGYHVLTISAAGHVKHYPQSANIRLLSPHSKYSHFRNLANNAGKNKSNNDDINVGSAKAPWTLLLFLDSRFVSWLLACVFFLTYIRAEWTEMSKMGLGTYLRTDIWNVFELTQLFCLGCVLYMTLVYYFQCDFIIKNLPFYLSNYLASDIQYTPSIEIKSISSTLGTQSSKWLHGYDLFYWLTSWLSVQQTQDIDMLAILVTYQRLTDFAAITSALSFLKIFKFLRMNSTLNLLWKVLGMATKDLMGFLVIFNLIFLSYSLMGYLAFGFAMEEFSDIWSSYGTCFHMLAGDFDYDQLSLANPRVAPFFFGSFVVLVFQILVNMFVAILSEYYEVAKDANTKLQDDDIEYDVIQRCRHFLDACAPKVVLKENELIELKPDQTVRLISTNLVDQEMKRQRAKKLFRGAVWRVVALLRFGMKFDRKIAFERRASHKEESFVSRTLHIPLSEAFDHKTIKRMLPRGITVRLQGDSLLGNDILLRVERHSALSVECKVVGSGYSELKQERGDHNGNNEGGLADDANNIEEEETLELLGGERLRIPWQLYALHVLKALVYELKIAIMRATKLWDPLATLLVNDYHLGRLLDDARADGRTTLRYDEVFRIVDLFLRKDRRKNSYSQSDIRRETALIMYRFRKSLVDMPSREKEGHNYRPNPLDTSKIELGSLEHLSDMLAENCHDIWALERIKQGWTFGDGRNCDQKTHPNLLPYHQLPKSEQDFDYRTSMETLKTILCLNFQITRNSSLPSYLRNSRTTSQGGGGASWSFGSSTGGRSSFGGGGGGASGEADEGSETGNEAGAGAAAESGNDNGPGASSTTTTRKTRRRPSSNSGGGSSSRGSWLLKGGLSSSVASLDDLTSPYFVETGHGEVYCPRPLDTSGIALPLRLLLLVDLLAENAHEVWSKGRMDEGWRYGPVRDDKAKTHPCLVPFVFLTDEEKDYDVNTAMGTLKMLLAMGFSVTDKTS